MLFATEGLQARQDGLWLELFLRFAACCIYPAEKKIQISIHYSWQTLLFYANAVLRPIVPFRSKWPTLYLYSRMILKILFNWGLFAHWITNPVLTLASCNATGSGLIPGKNHKNENLLNYYFFYSQNHMLINYKFRLWWEFQVFL